MRDAARRGANVVLLQELFDGDYFCIEQHAKFLRQAEELDRHPTVKMLALSFLLLIGVTLIAEGLGQKIPKGYIYSAIAFAVLVEMLNIRVSKRKRAPEPVHLRQAIVPD